MCQVYLVRHAQSQANIGEYVVDARLTEHGKSQAAKLSGHFDLVICSVMTRAKETLEYSKITHDKVVYSEDAREMKTHIGDFLPGEKRTPESPKELMNRLDNLMKDIQEYSKKYKKILIVSHYYTLMYLTSTNKEDLRHNRKFPDGLDLDNAVLTSYQFLKLTDLYNSKIFLVFKRQYCNEAGADL